MKRKVLWGTACWRGLSRLIQYSLALPCPSITLLPFPLGALAAGWLAAMLGQHCCSRLACLFERERDSYYTSRVYTKASIAAAVCLALKESSVLGGHCPHSIYSNCEVKYISIFFARFSSQEFSIVLYFVMHWVSNRIIAIAACLSWALF